jgi:signal transduction histidine kinase
VHPDDKLMVAKQMEAKQEGKPGAIENYTFHGVRKNGTSCWIEIFSRTVHHRGEPADFVMALDATEKVRMQEKLSEAYQQLEEQISLQTDSLSDKTRELQEARTKLLLLDKMKFSILTTVSHDLRTPLTSILGFSSLLRKDLEKLLPEVAGKDSTVGLVEKITKKIGIIESEGSHLSNLVDDFLALSRLEAGEVDWNDDPVDPAQTLRKLGEKWSLQLEESENIAFRWSVPEALCVMPLDAQRLERAVEALLDNAVKFTESGTISLHAAMKEDHIRICVEDTGRGIPDDELERIFEVFHRVEQGDTLRRTRRGSGVGLASAREIVTHYQGTVDVRSTLGKGSNFCISLPV